MIALHLVNMARVPAPIVRRVEAALERQVDEQADRYWPLGPVTFRRHAPLKLWLERRTLRHCRGCTGYHNASSTGPYAVVRYTPRSKLWQLTASHELIEMLADPYPGRGRGPWRELADPVARDWYWLDGVVVSDFVTPAFFTGAPGRRDWLARLPRHRQG